MPSSSVELSAPYTLFRLSLPHGAAYRACHTTPVESRKRKRSVELAAAVDGDAVHIYDPRTTKTVSSYAVPSTTRFSCAPTSAIHTADSQKKLRRTYAATSAPKKELFCWQESLDDAGGVERFSTNTNCKRDVVHLIDPPQTQRNNGNERGVVAVFTDGSLKAYSPGLKKEKWALESPVSGSTILYAATTTFATARKALFKNRPALLAAFQDADSPPTILLLLARKQKSLAIRILGVPSHGSRPARNLVTIVLPGQAAADSSFALHFPSATLYHLTSSALTTYDLAQEKAPRTSSLVLPACGSESIQPPSMLRISSSSVLVATSEGVSLYDTKFGSLQAHVSLDSQPSTALMSRASTPASSAAPPTGEISLTSYMSELDLAVGFTQNGIVGIQLRFPNPAEWTRNGTSLMDAICKGVKSLQVNDLPSADNNELATQIANRNHQIDATIDRLRECVANKDDAGFDRIFCDFAGFDISKAVTSEPSAQSNGVVNGSAGSDEDTAVAKIQSPFETPFKIPKPSKTVLPTRFTHAVLGLCFTKNSTAEDKKMKFTIFPAYTLRYLVKTGNFSTLPLPVQDGLVEALIDQDPSMRTAEWFLRYLPELSIHEVVRAIQLCLISTRASIKQQTAVLRTSLTRLAAFSHSAIISVLQDLPSETQFLLVRLLENELLDYELDASETLGINDIRTIADLLTALVDAIGMSGLLLPETEELLQTLAMDVDDALVSVEEAAELKGLLEELFRHINWTPSTMAAYKSAKITASSSSSKKKAITATTTTITTSTAPIQLSASTQSYIEKARAKKARRLARIEAAKAGLPPPPATPKPVKRLKPTFPNNVPIGISPKKFLKEQRKQEKSRRDAKARKKFIEKMQNRSERSVGHKKMLRLMGVTRAHLEKQDQPVPTKMAVQSSPILPMGVAALRRLANPSYGGGEGLGAEFRPREEKEEKEGASTMAGVFWREGLAAGVYSVESVVV
ncbi:hypothetical protein EX30DRAFT_150223 [Ascodesmis nigricans]|uniref:Uncharacterized protein n=1 Tax=Ascodesmis nigricans TaxID=341454 RepID=A0A4S2N2A9_9PEZI|nr:hypothetical protein EX30DRAFT_150223 [Ascodesmis nigricans]